METLHPEGESPFVLKEDNAPENTEASGDISYVECPVDSCGEILLLQELEYHLELHSEESGDHLQDPGPDTKVETPPSGPSRAHREAERHRRSDHEPEHSDRQTKAISAWKRLLKMPGPSSTYKVLSPKRSHDDKTGGHFSRGKRLGVSYHGLHPSYMAPDSAKSPQKSQLGKYAHEDRMPDWLVVLLKKSGQVTSQGEQKTMACSYSASSANNPRCRPSLGPAAGAKLVDKVCLPLPSMRAACVETEA
jgi:hypothetical protein